LDAEQRRGSGDPVPAVPRQYSVRVDVFCNNLCVVISAARSNRAAAHVFGVIN
jgi:hypothetical protein